MTETILSGFASGDGQTDDQRNGECSDGRGALRTDGGRVDERPTGVDPVTDPAVAAERESVEATTATFLHDEREHCEAGAAGRAIVGVTNESGEVLLWVHEGGHVVLPNVVVDAGEDWAAVARRDVAGTAGLDVTLDGVERVREVDHVLDTGAAADGTESEHLATTHHVVFGASPARPASERDGPTIDTCNDVWSADWYAELPVDPDEDGDGSVLADVRLFLDGERTETRDASGAR